MKSTRRILLTLALAGSSIALASCAKDVLSSCYLSYAGANGMAYVLRADVTDTNGYMTSVSLEGVPTVSILARLSAKKVAELGEERLDKDYIRVNGVEDYDGTTKTVYYAKHISLNGMTWTGKVRDTEVYPTSFAGEDHVVYCADNALVGGDGLSEDYLKYMTADVESTSRYRLGVRYQAYYEAVTQGTFQILKEETATESAKHVTGFTYTYANAPLAPLALPDGKMYRSEIDTEWAASAKALSEQVVAKLPRLNFKNRVVGPDKRNKNTYRADSNGDWSYNPTLTDNFAQEDFDNQDLWVSFVGAKSSAMPAADFVACMNAINIGFAAGEYTSIR